MLKALIFDLDGTLAHTDSVHFPTWIEVLRPHGIGVTRKFYEDRLSGRTSAEVVDEFLPDLSPEEYQALIEAEHANSVERTRHLGPLPGLLNILEEGEKLGLRRALVTNSTEEDARVVLEALGLDEAFDPVVLPSELSESKPAPLPYEEALDRMGISPEETLAFEDSPTGTTAAVKAGVPTVGIASTHNPRTLEDAGAFLVVGDYVDAALYELLDRLSESP